MFERILLPLDGSTLSEAMIPHVSWLAKTCGSRVTAYHVTPEETVRPIEQSRLRLPGGEEPEVREYLQRAVDGLTRQGIAADQAVDCGHAPERISIHAAEHRYDLIAMSTHGYTGSARWVYGSVTDKVLQTSSVPVLLVRVPEADVSEPSALRTTVVVPLDGSPLSESVLPHAAALARAGNLTIALVRVILTEGTAAGFIGPDFYQPEMYQAMEEEAEAYVKARAAGLEREGLKVKGDVQAGYPPDQIIEYARMLPGSLIVMSTHGQTGDGRWALGTVADRVMRGSASPVLVVRPAPERLR